MSSTELSNRLWGELITYPFNLALGTFTLSTFMSHILFGIFDWRAITLCVTAELGSMCIDHYKDNRHELMNARKNQDHSVLAVFQYAKAFLGLIAFSFIFALIMSPLMTSVLVACFFGPAFLWSYEFTFGSTQTTDSDDPSGKDKQLKKFVIKRIPGMKPVMAGLIKGYGIFSVVRSVLPDASSGLGRGPWTLTQMMIWFTLEGMCASMLLDVRDFDEDLRDNVPTIPVLLKSVFKARALITLIHMSNMVAFRSNVFIILGSLYSIAFCWTLNNRSPRKYFFFCIHMRTVVIFLYGASKLLERYFAIHTQ